jgi:hypothetical protein
MDIDKLVREGLYKTLVEFNKNDSHLNELLKYC